MLSRQIRGMIRGTLIVAMLCASAAPAQAAFHRWLFTEVFSNADGSVQFIEMRTAFNGENLMHGHTLTSDDKSFTVTTDLPSFSTSNKSFIFGTAAFAALPGAAAPDYIIPANFFNPAGDFLDWAGFDSMTIGSGKLPLDGFHSLLKNGTTADNSPTNFAGIVGQIDLRVPVPGDTNGDSLVDVVDLNNVRNNFGLQGPDILGDTNDDDEVNIIDLNSVRNNFGTGGSSAVPEPSSAVLGATVLAGVALTLRRTRR